MAYILCNPAYIGKLRWNPAGRTQRAFDCPELIFADGAHVGIIDPDLWRLVQLRMEWLKTNAGSAHHAGRRGDWLAGLVRCSACGGTLVFVKPNYWKCSRYIRGACSTSQHISDTKLRAMVLTCLEHDLGSPSMELTLLPRAPSDEKPEQRRLRAWQRELSNRLERLRLAYLAGTEELETYSREKEALERQEQAARRQLQDLTASPSSMDMELEAVRLGLAAFLASPQVNPERKQLAVRSIISQIFFDKNSGTLCVQYRLSPYPPPVEMRS
ncbi:hypothetical protein SDC9_151628 [bioreactor metagenome]|uniref:Recombinase zinc beta ribbon domain-containing protein n=1 Tax=bioreactor metagenome TaxID=1076179 RepID=A0A645ESK6_9ZZZZ